MSKNLEMSNLLDLYGCLLTEKQFNIMDMYYNDDLSLGEIAEDLHISRQGVHDTVKRGEETITDYENKLGLYAQQNAYLKQLNEFKSLAMKIFEECEKVSFSQQIAEKTTILLKNLDKQLNEFDNSGMIEKEDI
ncbi:MAG: YlxM family DNA-binding protein [Hominimerdicola sp.]